MRLICITIFLHIIFIQSLLAQIELRPKMQGCVDTGFKRLVNVSTNSQFISALENAQPGDQIRLAPGQYLDMGSVAIRNSGTELSPITICGAKNTWPIIKGGRFEIRGSYVNVSGILFEGPNYSNNNVIIMNCANVLFTHNEVRYGDWHAGIAVEGVSNSEISYNHIHNNGITDIDHGIYYRQQAGKNIIANNIIEKNAGRGVSIHSNSELAISDLVLVHNTIVKNGSTGILLHPNAGVNNYVANNVLAENGLVHGYKQLRLKSGQGNYVLNNILWSSVSSYQGIEYWSDVNVSANTILNNRELSPAFVDLNNSNYKLTENSPARSLAVSSLSVPQDYESILRDVNPDAGAFEFTAIVPVPPTETTAVDIEKPVVQIVSPTNGSSVLVNSKVVINAVASDNISIKNVNFYVNGKLLCSTSVAEQYKCTWSVPGKRNILYKIKAEAFDSSGLSSNHNIEVRSSGRSNE